MTAKRVRLSDKALAEQEKTQLEHEAKRSRRRPPASTSQVEPLTLDEFLAKVQAPTADEREEALVAFCARGAPLAADYIRVSPAATELTASLATTRNAREQVSRQSIAFCYFFFFVVFLYIILNIVNFLMFLLSKKSLIES